MNSREAMFAEMERASEPDWVWTDSPADVDLPGIQGMYKGQVWLETVLGALSWFGLLLAAGAAGVNLVTGGLLQQIVPAFPILLALCIVLGVDATAGVTVGKVYQAWHSERYMAMWGWLCLAVPLLLVFFQSLWLAGLQMTDHLTELQALAHIGMSADMYTFERAAIGTVAFTAVALARPKVLWRLAKDQIVTRFSKRGERLAKQDITAAIEDRNAPTPIRKSSGQTAMQKAKRVWRPGMTVTQLERAAKISHSSAARCRERLMHDAA